MKKHVSTQTSHSNSNEHNQIIRSNFSEVNKTYEKLKKCLYPDLFNCQKDKNSNHIF